MDAETIALLGAMFDDELEGYDEDLDDELEGFHDDDDDDELGAFAWRRRFSARTTRRGTAARRIRRPRRAIVLARKKAAYLNKLVPAIPGVPASGARNFPLGFGFFVFVNGGPTFTTLTANPQRPYKGARLVIDIARSVGAVAELVTVTSLNIGQDNQLVSAAALPAAGFRPDATNTVLALDPATPGIDIVLGLAVSAAPGVGETITVSAMLVGPTIG